jgi:hypothetical protein
MVASFVSSESGFHVQVDTSDKRITFTAREGRLEGNAFYLKTTYSFSLLDRDGITVTVTGWYADSSEYHVTFSRINSERPLDKGPYSTISNVIYFYKV